MSKSYPSYIARAKNVKDTKTSHRASNKALMALFNHIEDRLESLIKSSEQLESLDKFNLREQEIFNRGSRKILRELLAHKPQ